MTRSSSALKSTIRAASSLPRRSSERELTRLSPAPASPVIAAAPEQKEQHEDYEDSIHDFFPFSRGMKHEPCQPRIRREQGEDDLALSIARIAPCPRVGTGQASTGLATCVIDVD